MKPIQLLQIENGAQLKSILTSYAANKVTTTIAKDASNNYNVEEAIAAIMADMDALLGTSYGSGGAGTGSSGEVAGVASLGSLQTALNDLKNKVVKDSVRVEMTVDTAGAVTIPADFDTVVPKCDKNQKLPVYNLDNSPVIDATGAPVTLDLAAGTLSGVPSIVDVNASSKTEDGSTVYVPAGAISIKVFPVGEWTLATLPATAMLDNEELSLIAYNTAINKLAIELAKDNSLIESVKTLVGSEAVSTQLNDYVKKADISSAIPADGAVDTKVASEKAVADAVKTVADKVTVLETAPKTLTKYDDIAVTSETAVTTFDLTETPDNMRVMMYINTVPYMESKAFTVDRATKQITWTFTKAAGGFDITAELTDEVNVVYTYTEVVAE